MGKTTLETIMRKIVAEKKFHMAGKDYGQGVYEIEGVWKCKDEKCVNLKITALKNLRYVFEYTYYDSPIPEEKVYDVLRFLSHVNKASVYTKYMIDFENNNIVQCDLALTIGCLEDSVSTKYSDKIEVWFLRMLEIGFGDTDMIYSSLKRIIKENENPDVVGIEYAERD